MNKIEIEKVDNYSFNLVAPNNKRFGTLEMQVDGHFTFDGMYSWVLREITDRLDEVNKPLDDLQKIYFENERELFEEKAEKEYGEVLKSGMFFEWHSGMSGDWDRDREDWLVEYAKLEELRRDYTPY